MALSVFNTAISKKKLFVEKHGADARVMSDTGLVWDILRPKVRGTLTINSSSYFYPNEWIKCWCIVRLSWGILL